VTFAQQMVTDHTQANQKLGDIARKLDISVPDEAAITDKAELKGFDSETLPKLEQHLEHAKALQAKHGK